MRMIVMGMFAALTSLLVVGVAQGFAVPEAYDYELRTALDKAPGMVFFCDDRRPEECAEAKLVFGEVGKAFKKHDDVAILYVQCDGSHVGCIRYQVQVQNLPALRWIPKGGSPVDAEDVAVNLNADQIIAEIESRTGLLGEKAPPLKNVVVVLDARNFDQIVMDPTRDVFVEFYAPWCAHCKALAPKYQDLARIFHQERHVVVAMLDAEEHKDIRKKYDVRGYPTLLLFKRGEDKEMVKFEGVRQLPQLVEFLNEHTESHFNPDGSLTLQSGVSSGLSTIVADFVKDGALDTASAAKVKELMASSVHSGHSSFDYYVRLLDKLTAKGQAFLNSESGRLSKMFDESAGVTAAQRNNARRRLNILESIKEEL